MMFMRQALLFIGIGFICLGLPVGVMFFAVASVAKEPILLAGPAISLLFAIGGGLMVFNSIKQSRRERRLVNTGHPIDCKLVGLLPTEMRINHQRLSRAVVITPQGRTYRSVGFNPRVLPLQIGQPIVTYVNPADPDDAWVDVYPAGHA